MFANYKKLVILVMSISVLRASAMDSGNYQGTEKNTLMDCYVSVIESSPSNIKLKYWIGEEISGESTLTATETVFEPDFIEEKSFWRSMKSQVEQELVKLVYVNLPLFWGKSVEFGISTVVITKHSTYEKKHWVCNLSQLSH